MSLVARVDKVSAFELTTPFPSIPNLFVAALGEVPTTGWSNIRLLPVIYVQPPADGIQDFEFVGSPAGIGADVMLPVAATYAGHAPAWLKGVRVKAVQNAIECPIKRTKAKARDLDIARLRELAGNVIVRKSIAVYDDSFQPIGMCSLFHVKMKKLRHELTLTVTGPDEAKIRRCIDQALGAGVLAAIIAAFATGGMGAAQAFVSAALSSITACLGDSYSVRFDDESHWIEWCT
jgi:hypothetical protein